MRLMSATEGTGKANRGAYSRREQAAPLVFLIPARRVSPGGQCMGKGMNGGLALTHYLFNHLLI